MFKTILSIFLLQSNGYQNYFDLLRKYPETLYVKGSSEEGEIEILDEPSKMDALSQSMGRKVGIVAEDRYWIWLNDAVKFPSGKEGVYGRMLWRSSLNGPAGVAVLILDEETGSIYLNCNYRHATRSWELEMPRGVRENGESAEEAARREVSEETGLSLGQLIYLGSMAPDSGLTNTVVPIYLATVSSTGAAHPDSSEAIAGLLKVSLDDLKSGFKEGSLALKMYGKEKKVCIRESFLAYALFLSELKGLL